MRLPPVLGGTCKCCTRTSLMKKNDKHVRRPRPGYAAGLADVAGSQKVLMRSQEGQSEEEARKCPACGGRLGLKLATSGGFIGCSNYPDCSYTRPLDLQALGEEGEEGTGEAHIAKIMQWLRWDARVPRKVFSFGSA